MTNVEGHDKSHLLLFIQWRDGLYDRGQELDTIVPKQPLSQCNKNQRTDYQLQEERRETGLHQHQQFHCIHILGCSNQVCGENSTTPQMAEDVWHEVQNVLGALQGHYREHPDWRHYCIVWEQCCKVPQLQSSSEFSRELNTLLRAYGCGFTQDHNRLFISNDRQILTDPSHHSYSMFMLLSDKRCHSHTPPLPPSSLTHTDTDTHMCSNTRHTCTRYHTLTQNIF